MKKWSEQELNVLTKQIKKYPGNLKKAFEITAYEINRTPAAIANYWYRNKDKVDTCFFVASTSRIHKNAKKISNTNRNSSIKRGIKSLLERLIKML